MSSAEPASSERWGYGTWFRLTDLKKHKMPTAIGPRRNAPKARAGTTFSWCFLSGGCAPQHVESAGPLVKRPPVPAAPMVSKVFRRSGLRVERGALYPTSGVLQRPLRDSQSSGKWPLARLPTKSTGACRTKGSQEAHGSLTGLAALDPPAFPVESLLSVSIACARYLVAKQYIWAFGEHSKMRVMWIVVLSTALAECASSSSDITPSYVSPVAYQG